MFFREREELTYDKFTKSDSFLPFCACMLSNWAGQLALAGNVASTSWARVADLNGDALPITADLDSQPSSIHIHSTYSETCVPYLFVTDPTKHPSRNWYVRRTSPYEHTGYWK